MKLTWAEMYTLFREDQDRQAFERFYKQLQADIAAGVFE